MTKVDPANRTVKTKGGKELRYDYLFVCLGVKNYPEAVPGLKEHGYHNYSLDGALKMRDALSKFNGREIIILTPETPYRCGCYPFEIAGKIKYFAQRKRRNVKVKLVHVMSKQQILQQFKDVAKQFFKIHEKLGIKYIDGVKVERVEKGKIVTQGGDVIGYDLLIYVPPVRIQDALRGSGLEKNEKVLETTFPTFRSKRYDDVFIPTDSAMPSVGLPIAGIFMHPAAIAAADMLISDLTGVRATPPYPENVVAATDFGPTGLMVSFDIKDNGDGTASQKMYVTLNSPIVKYLKLAFYLGWINSLK